MSLFLMLTGYVRPFRRRLLAALVCMALGDEEEEKKPDSKPAKDSE